MHFIIFSVICLWIGSITEGVPLDSEIVVTFEQFKQVFGKSYSTDGEESIRRDNFYRSVKWIQENQNNKYGANFAINEMSDLGEDEFQGMDLSEQSEEYFESIPITKITPDHNLPVHYDWREHVHFQPIEHQHSCGSCWSFSGIVQNVDSQNTDTEYSQLPVTRKKVEALFKDGGSSAFEQCQKESAQLLLILFFYSQQ